MGRHSKKRDPILERLIDPPIWLLAWMNILWKRYITDNKDLSLAIGIIVTLLSMTSFLLVDATSHSSKVHYKQGHNSGLKIGSQVTESNTANQGSFNGGGAPQTGTPICGESILNSPYNYNGAAATYTDSATRPAGTPSFGAGGTFSNATRLRVIASGDFVSPSDEITADWSVQANTVYYFDPGVHTWANGTGIYATLNWNSNDVFIGGYSGGQEAVIDGMQHGASAVSETAIMNNNNPSGPMTLEYLKIQNFNAGAENNAVVNRNTGDGWTVKYDTFDHLGSQLMGGGWSLGVKGNAVVEYNCFSYPYQTAIGNGGEPANITVSHNEIHDTNWNNDATLNAHGSSAGVKFTVADNITITDNWIYNNIGTGIWCDTNCYNVDIEKNYMDNNSGVALNYEISYNARIADNTFIHNGLGEEPAYSQGSGNLLPTIYVQESGSDSRAGSAYSSSLDITGNVFTNNWDGVYIYNNTGRGCWAVEGIDPACTRIYPAGWSYKGTGAKTVCQSNYTIDWSPPPTPDYNELCHWWSKNVNVFDNTFTLDRAAIDAIKGSSVCTNGNLCGFNGIAAFLAGGTTYTTTGCPVPHIPYTCQQIMYEQNSYDMGNLFHNNSYSGSWSFWGYKAQTAVMAWSAWHGTPLNRCSGDVPCNTNNFAQDSESSWSG